MGRKGKTQKHTAAEINAKHKAAKELRGAAGGGKKMQDIRKKNKEICNITCKICLSSQPNIKSMENHYLSKHTKIDWDSVKINYF